MRSGTGSGLLLVPALAGLATAAVITLGEQDFTDGSFVGFDAFNTQSAGEPPPFESFRGSDAPGGTDFSASWTFAYPAQAVSGASITIGLLDGDPAAPGEQVAAFTMDGFDLTAQLNALLEADGGTQTRYDAYTLALPAGSLAALSDGSATFTLALQAPGLGGLPGGSSSTTVFNGAGLDFAALEIGVQAVPEPASLALLAGGLLALASTRRRRGPG
jgi:hypothetical protein